MTFKHVMYNLRHLGTVWWGDVYHFCHISSSVAIHGAFYLNEKYKLQVLIVYYGTDPRARRTILGLIVKIKVWSNIGYNICFSLVD